MRLVFYRNEKDNQAHALDLDWLTLVGLLRDVRRTPCNPCIGKDCPHKTGMAWSPAHVQGTRSNAHVQAVHLAVFDLDGPGHAGLSGPDLVALAQRLGALRFLMHTTHSHTPARACLRLVVPLSRPATPAEFPRVHAGLIAAYGIPADPSCKDLSRLYYFPSAPQGADAWCEESEGQGIVDVDALLAVAPPAPPPAPPHVDEPDNTPIEIEPLRARLRELRARYAKRTDGRDDERLEVVSAVLAGRAVAAPGGRDRCLNVLASVLAFAFGAAVPFRSVLELVRPSLDATDLRPEGFEHWRAELEDMHARALARKADRDAAKEREDAELYARLQASFGGETREQRALSGDVDEDTDEDDESPALAPAPPSPSPSYTAPGQPAAPPPAEDTSWQELLRWRDDAKGLKPIGYNAFVILTNHPAVKNTIRWNTLRKRIEVHGGPLAGGSLSTLAARASNWLAAGHWGLTVPSNELERQLHAVAERAAFDPLAEHLNALTWDGVPRLDTWLERYLGVSSTGEGGRDLGPYHRAVGRAWAVGAVARGLSPGCKVDTCMVLIGRQGARKSTAVRILGGAFASDSKIVIGEKDAQMRASVSWIIEMPELAATRKTDTESVKAFLSSPIDMYRAPYGRAVEEAPRRCVFVGTTNEDAFLTDLTGNRRFWPVAVGEIDTAALEADRDQIWAEAVVAFKNGEAWHLMGEMADVAEHEAEERVQSSALSARVVDWWYNLPSKARPESLRTLDVAEKALMLDASRTTRAIEQEIATVLRKMGFVRRRVTEGGVRAWRYHASRAALEAPQGRAPTLMVLPGGKEGVNP